MATSSYSSTTPSSEALHQLISAERVEGTDVYNTNGEHLGHVEDVIIDKVSGRVAYSVMAFGGFLGIGEKYHPIPWSMLRYDPAQNGYVVPLDKATLEKAPSYDIDELKFGDRTWDRKVHDYYNAPLYWM